MIVKKYEIRPLANLSGANLSGANLSKADLSKADLSKANLREAYLYEADLSGADLYEANLREAYLYGANFREANLYEADLSGADLSGAKIFSGKEWFFENFETTTNGVVVYKDLGSTYFEKPDTWTFEEGQYLQETCNFVKTDDCGCGVSFATLDWLKKNSNNQIWECLIEWEDLLEVCVPYNTDGKARCSRLKLVKIYTG